MLSGSHLVHISQLNQQQQRAGEKRNAASTSSLVVDVVQQHTLQQVSHSKKARMEVSTDLQPIPVVEESKAVVVPNQHKEDEVRTVFVSGLPMDVKYRELHNLFRFVPGFEYCTLKMSPKPGKNPTPVGFVTFESREYAKKVMTNMQGLKFDLDMPSTLRLEYAKSNTKNKGKPTSIGGSSHIISYMPQHVSSNGTPVLPPEVLTQAPLTGYDLIQSPSPAQIQPSFQVPTLHPISPLHPQPAAQLFTHIAGAPIMNLAVAGPTNPGTAFQQPAAAVSQTLIISNIGPTTTEKELTSIFSRFQGFIKARIFPRSGFLLAFIDFSDPNSASFALNRLQGARLNDNSPMRIDYG